MTGEDYTSHLMLTSPALDAPHPRGAFSCPRMAISSRHALPDHARPTGDREREEARRHPERETLELATAGAAKVLGADHSVTRALARASITMAKADLWQARLAVKTLCRDQREEIAEAGES